MDATQDSILSFESVATDQDPAYTHPLNEVSFDLKPGDMALFRFDRISNRSPLADCVLGLVPLKTGTIRFRGKSWGALSPGRAAHYRGDIGRFFGNRGWVNHLDVDENVTLRQRHHSHRSIEQIENETAALAALFSFPHGIPNARPAALDPHTLQRAAAIRMLLGKPSLLVVDEPLAGLYSDVLDPLKIQLHAARHRGAAVLWITADPAVWEDASLEPALRGDLGQDRLGLSRS